MSYIAQHNDIKFGFFSDLVSSDDESYCKLRFSGKLVFDKVTIISFKM
jgi:hypothetical protein